MMGIDQHFGQIAASAVGLQRAADALERAARAQQAWVAASYRGGMTLRGRNRITGPGTPPVDFASRGKLPDPSNIRYLVAPSTRREHTVSDNLWAEQQSRRRILTDLLTKAQTDPQSPAEEDAKAQGGPSLLDVLGSLQSVVKSLGSGDVLGSVQGLINGIGMAGKLGNGGMLEKITKNPVANGVMNGLGKVGQAIGKAIPGVGEAIAAAGPLGAAFAGLAGPAAIAVAAVQLFAEGVKHAVSDLAAFRDAMLQSGGSSSQVAQLQAFGIDPGLAARFRQGTQVGSNVYSQIARAQLGVAPVTNVPFAEVDETGDLLKAIEGLRGIRNERERRRIAMQLPGGGELLKAASTSRAVAAQQVKDASVWDSIKGKGGQEASDLQANSERLFGNLGAMVTAAFSPFIAPLTELVGLLANVAREGAQWINLVMAIPKAMHGLYAAWGKVFGAIFGIADKFSAKTMLFNILEKVVGWLVERFEQMTTTVTMFAEILPAAVGKVAKSVRSAADLLGNTEVGKQLRATADGIIKSMEELSRDNAMQKNTDAVKQNTAAVEHAAGVFGTSQRARGTLGSDGLRNLLSMADPRKAMEARALALGYWTL